MGSASYSGECWIALSLGATSLGAHAIVVAASTRGLRGTGRRRERHAVFWCRLYVSGCRFVGLIIARTIGGGGRCPMLFTRRRDHRCCLGAIEGNGATMEAWTYLLDDDVQGSSELLPSGLPEAEIRVLDGATSVGTRSKRR